MLAAGELQSRDHEENFATEITEVSENPLFLVLCALWLILFVFIVLAMGLKPSPLGETFRILYWGDGKLSNRFT